MVYTPKEASNEFIVFIASGTAKQVLQKGLLLDCLFVNFRECHSEAPPHARNIMAKSNNASIDCDTREDLHFCKNSLCSWMKSFKNNHNGTFIFQFDISNKRGSLFFVLRFLVKCLEVITISQGLKPPHHISYNLVRRAS